MSALARSSLRERSGNLAGGAPPRNGRPGLLDVAPRPGGFVRRNVEDVLAPQKKDERRATGDVVGEVPRPADVPHEPSKEERQESAVRRCSIAVGTVMLLARRTYDDITAEHLENTEKYFGGLRQQDGYPRNVGQLMQLLTNLKKAGRIVVTAPSYEDPEDARSFKGAGSNASSEPQRTTTKPKRDPPSTRDRFDIRPLVYSFKVSRNPAPGSIMTATLPPYWLYHDHAFGLIWMLFHEEERHIGISQLHWCLRFLLDLRNTSGEYTDDVNTCIQAVQDSLIEQYAKLGMTMKEVPERNVRRQSVKSSEDTDSELVVDGKSEDAPGLAATSASVGKERSRDEAECTMDRRALGNEGFPAMLSITYNEMTSRGPAPRAAEPTGVERIFGASATLRDAAPRSDDGDDDWASTGPNDSLRSNTNAGELVGFLNDARRRHVERIKKEVEGLHELEKFMESIGAKPSSVYVTDDLARRLEKLEGRGRGGGLVKETEKLM